MVVAGRRRAGRRGRGRPPTGRFTISEGENWVALAVFFVAALVASTLAERERCAPARLRSAARRPTSRPRWRALSAPALSQ
jgi:hypothetical protein